MMNEQLFAMAIGIAEPVHIERIEFENGELHIHMNFRRGGRFACPECGAEDLAVHDTIDKVWRHLNFFQYKCFIHFRTPRVKCEKCGERQWLPPWGRKNSGFTLLFEAFIMALAKYMPMSAVAEIVGEHDTKLWRIFHHYVKKAQEKRDFSDVTQIGVDETSAKKGHKYVTVAADLATGDVIYVTEGKNAETLKKLADELPNHGGSAENITDAAIDLGAAFTKGVRENFKNAEITYDKFHVIKLLNRAIDSVRIQEVATNQLLKKTKYIWLKNPENLTEKQQKDLKTITKEHTKIGKCYEMKLALQDIYKTAQEPKVAKELIDKWYNWAIRSRIGPMKGFAKTLSNHMDGIMKYFESRLTSGVMEGINSRIQEVKRRAKGFRNISNFIDMIYLVCGNLDLGLPT